MPHPTAETLRRALRDGPVYPDDNTLLAEAASALDAYHEALDGLEIVKCEHCYKGSILTDHGGTTQPMHLPCKDCKSTGKRLRKRGT